MDYYCPDCNSPLTHSIVGYLCHSCGNVHSHEKAASGQISSGPRPIAIHTSSPVSQKPTQLPQKPTVSDRPKSSAKPKFAHKVKHFVVPKITELPKPTDENHQIAAPLAKPINNEYIATPPLAAAVANNDTITTQVSSITPAGFEGDTPIEEVAGDKTLTTASYVVLAICAILTIIVIVLAMMYATSGLN